MSGFEIELELSSHLMTAGSFWWFDYGIVFTLLIIPILGLPDHLIEWREESGIVQWSIEVLIKTNHKPVRLVHSILWLYFPLFPFDRILSRRGSDSSGEMGTPFSINSAMTCDDADNARLAAELLSTTGLFLHKIFLICDCGKCHSNMGAVKNDSRETRPYRTVPIIN